MNASYEDYELADLLPDLLGEVESLKAQFSQNGTYESMLEEANSVKYTVNKIIDTLNSVLNQGCENCAYLENLIGMCDHCSDYNRWKKK